MLSFSKLRVIAPLGILLLCLPADSLQAKNRKADKLYKMGVQAEARKDYDKALDYFQQALKIDPTEPAYELAARRARFESGTAHIDAGNKLRKAEDYEKALAEYQKAFNVDPGSMIAFQDMSQVKELLEEKAKGLKPGEKPLTAVEKAQKQSLEMIQSMLPVPELKPVTNQISLLKMNNQPPKVLYETVGKLAGINVLFDPQMQPGKNANLDLNNVTLQEALDYIALLTKTYWKPVSANAIFVTEDSVTKRRDYEDEVVKVFYLKNPTSNQEFQEIVTAVRSVTDVRRMFQFNAENAVVVRDTVDKVALVEKLLHDLDKPKAEVVIDVIIMDVSSDVSSQIGAGLVSNGTNGLALPITFSPTNPITSATGTGAAGTGGTGATSTTTTTTTTTGTAASTGSFVALSQLHLSTNQFSTSLPGAMLQAVMSDSKTKVQDSPELRVSDGQKVTLKIGEKYPYATGSFQPGVGTVGVSPLVSTQFQFVDVGVNVELTPHVHGDSRSDAAREHRNFRHQQHAQPGRLEPARHWTKEERGRHPPEGRRGEPARRPDVGPGYEHDRRNSGPGQHPDPGQIPVRQRVQGQAEGRADDRADPAYRPQARYYGPRHAAGGRGNRSDGETDLCAARRRARGRSCPTAPPASPRQRLR